MKGSRPKHRFFSGRRAVWVMTALGGGALGFLGGRGDLSWSGGNSSNFSQGLSPHGKGPALENAGISSLGDVVAGDGLRGLYFDLAAGNPVDWNAALDSANTSGNQALCAILIALWSDKDPASARAWAEQVERFRDVNHPPLMRIIAETWARKDPMAAMQGFVSTLYETALPQWVIFDVAVEKDPAIARRLVSTWPEHFTRIGSLECPRHFRAAADALALLPTKTNRLQGVLDLMEEWREAKPDEAKAWWLSPAADGVRDQMTSNIASLDVYYAEKAGSITAAYGGVPASRTAEAAENTPSNEPAALILQARARIATDPAAAFQLALQNLAGESRIKIVDEAISAQRLTDPEKARQLVLSLPSGTERDRLLSTFPSEASATTPTRASPAAEP